MEHNDGDSEDLDQKDMLKALRCFAENLLEDDEEEVSDDDSDSDDAAEESEESYYEAPKGDAATLWPTYEIRSRWLDALSKVQTVGEVALALQCFCQHAQAFGVMAEDPLEVERSRAPRNARVSSGTSARVGGTLRRHISSPMKKMGTGREGLSRAAAQSVRSYAE
mmetsp:Transcript_18643/g.41485  ORF Transcript_18643/g.41485 Transcript_18643/m.41485 type:complete len:166 (+) Transcript_18643:152-649(+)